MGAPYICYIYTLCSEEVQYTTFLHVSFRKTDEFLYYDIKIFYVRKSFEFTEIQGCTVLCVMNAKQFAWTAVLRFDEFMHSFVYFKQMKTDTNWVGLEQQYETLWSLSIGCLCLGAFISISFFRCRFCSILIKCICFYLQYLINNCS